MPIPSQLQHPEIFRITWDRSHRAPPLDDLFAPQFTPDAPLPAPGAVVSDVALALVEILAGIRSPEQVRPWVDAVLGARLARVYGRKNRAHTHASRPCPRPPFALLSTRASLPSAGIVEASAVVTDQRRVRAVAMRLEAIDHRWRVTELHVL